MGRSVPAALIVAVLWLAGAVVAWLWSAQPQLTWWRPALAWGAVGCGALLSAWSVWRAREGVLAWDGAAWTWSQHGTPTATGRVRPGLDLQHVLLVRWDDAASGCWLWTERRRCGTRWDDFRRAVYSRARPEALPAAEPPVAKP